MPIDRLTNLLSKIGVAPPNPTIGTFPWDGDSSNPVAPGGYAVPPPGAGPGDMPMGGYAVPPPGSGPGDMPGPVGGRVWDEIKGIPGRTWDEIKDPGIIPQAGPPPGAFDTYPVTPGGGNMGGGGGGGRPGMHRDQRGVWHYDSPINGGGGRGMGGGGGNFLGGQQRAALLRNVFGIDQSGQNVMGGSQRDDLLRRVFGIGGDPQGSPASAPYANPDPGYRPGGRSRMPPGSRPTRMAPFGLTSAFVNMLAQRRRMRQAAINPEFARGLSGTRPT